jgi:branched-chain amino acid transport system ATP-binding protein
VTVHGGSVWLDGEDLSSLPPHVRVAHGVSHVPQGRQLFPFMSVRDNLEMGAYPPAASAQRAVALEAVLDIFPLLRDRLRQNAGSLSGGEQQMCAIGRGLMLRPRYLLLDEPSLGLAPIVVRQVMNVVRGLAGRGIGILLVEQNVRLALRLADHAHVLEHGRIALQGPASALARDDGVRRAYLGL